MPLTATQAGVSARDAALGVLQAGRTGPRLLSRATFTAPDGTALGSYTPEVGPVWTDHNGVLRITGNALASMAGGQGVGSVDVGRSRVRLAATILMTVASGNVNIALLSRFVDKDNFWAALAGMFGASANTITIYEVVAGVFTPRASVPYTFAAATPYPLELLDDNATLTARIGATSVAWPTTANNTTTRKGVRIFTSAAADLGRIPDIDIWGL